MEVQSILAAKGTGVMTTRPGAKVARGGPTRTRRDNLRKVMAVMTQRRVRHLPVVEGGRLGGVIGIGDVVKNRPEEVERESNVLRDAYLATR